MMRNRETSSAGLASTFKVCQHIAYFLAIVKRHAAQQYIWNFRPAQFGLERPGLLVCAA